MLIGDCANNGSIGLMASAEVVQPQELHVEVADPTADPPYCKLIAIVDKSPCIAGGIDRADGSDRMEV